MNSFTGVSVQRFCTRCFYVIAVNWNIWRTKAWIGKHDFFWYKGIVLVKQIYFGCLNVLVFIFQINFFFKIFYFFRIYFSPAFILWGGIWLMPAGIYLYKFNNGSTRRMSISSFWCLLYEKCSNRKFFLVRIFPYLDWTRRFTPSSVLNRFQTLFSCFHFWLCTVGYRLSWRHFVNQIYLIFSEVYPFVSLDIRLYHCNSQCKKNEVFH